MLVFGIVMFFLGRRARQRAASGRKPGGKKIEELEHAKGLEIIDYVSFRPPPAKSSRGLPLEKIFH